MSALLAIGLLFQAAALTVVFGAFGRHAFRLVGPAFIVLAVVFHGVTEVIQLLGLAPNPYRALIPQAVVDEWVALVSVAILLMAVAYGFALSIPVKLLSQRNPGVTVLRWQVLLVVAAPLYVVALSGRASSQEEYWLGGLSSQFLTLAFVLASFDFIRRRGGRHFVPVLLAQSVLLAPVGSRWSVVAAALLTVWALGFVGRPPARRQGLTVLAVAVLATVIVSSARTAAVTDPASHFTAESGATPSQRVDLMIGGVKALPTAWRDEQFWADWIYRVDGNSLPALVSEASAQRGISPRGFDRMAGVGLVAVPRVFYPSKLSNDPTALNEEEAVVSHYGLPSNVDFLDPTLGMVYAYVGPVGLLVGAILIGVAFAVFDRWLFERVTTVRVFAGVGVLLCVLLYERGLQVYPLTLRGVVSLLILTKIVEVLWSAAPRATPRPVPRGGARVTRPSR
jgi:hypothetical protein